MTFFSIISFSQRLTLSKDDSNDLPKTLLAFPADSNRTRLLNPIPTSAPVNEQPPSEPETASTDREESPDIASTAASVQSPPLSPSALWPHCEDGQEPEALEDAFDEGAVTEGIRQEALLRRRRASSMDSDHERPFSEMPGVLYDQGKILKSLRYSISLSCHQTD